MGYFSVVNLVKNHCISCLLFVSKIIAYFKGIISLNAVFIIKYHIEILPLLLFMILSLAFFLKNNFSLSRLVANIREKLSRSKESEEDPMLGRRMNQKTEWIYYHTLRRKSR